jgi:hypothetical protein
MRSMRRPRASTFSARTSSRSTASPVGCSISPAPIGCGIENRSNTVTR